MKALRTLFMTIALLVASSAASQVQYDYTKVAHEITQGATTEMQKVEAIYRWMCSHIAYDTTYTIYDAATCWQKQRGVCQAYSLLFKELAAPLGIDIRVVSGLSKDATTGKVGDIGHSWIIYVSPDNYGYLIDPTWGAGSINNGTFVRSKDPTVWWCVDPRWFILTHFPEQTEFQLLTEPLTEAEWRAMPAALPGMAKLGYDSAEILREARSGRYSSFPAIYGEGYGAVRVESAPLEGELRVGRRYNFVLRSLTGRGVVIVENDKKWIRPVSRQGNIYTFDYVATEAGAMDIMMQRVADTTSYFGLMSYRVAAPTAAERMAAENYIQEEQARLERENVWATEELKQLAEGYAEYYQRFGFDGHAILREYRAGRLHALPQIYNSQGFDYRVVDIPLDAVLKSGHTYSFAIKAPVGSKPVIDNNGDWSADWEHDNSGNYRIEFTPMHAGKLELGYILDNGISCRVLIGYTVH